MKTSRYIYKVKNSYQIRKRIDGKLQHFATFRNYDDAVMEVELYEFCGWDWDLIMEVNDMEGKKSEEVVVRLLPHSYTKLRPGDLVTTSSSKKDYDGLTHRYSSKRMLRIRILAEHMDTDEQGTFTYDTWRVIKIMGEVIDEDF